MLVDNPDELVAITCQRCPLFRDHIIGMYDIDLLWSRFFPFTFSFITEDDSVCEGCDIECDGECRGECGSELYKALCDGIISVGLRKGVVKNMASDFRNMMALGFGLHIMMASGFAGVEKNGRMMV
ncbi:hypothetical protein Tco_0008930 [Tanacetum coccineum]